MATHEQAQGRAGFSASPCSANEVRENARAGKMTRPRNLAEALEVNPGTVYSWIARGQIKVIVVGRCNSSHPARRCVSVVTKQPDTRNASPGGLAFGIVVVGTQALRT